MNSDNINNEINNDGSSETITELNDGINNESNVGISKEMNETNSECCIEIINEKNNESSEITEKSKTNNGSADLIALDPNGSSSKRPWIMIRGLWMMILGCSMMSPLL